MKLTPYTYPFPSFHFYLTLGNPQSVLHLYNYAIS